MNQLPIHTIPVGGQEPMHFAHTLCWCHPIEIEPGIITHNAKDLRETRERIHHERPDEKWVLVGGFRHLIP